MKSSIALALAAALLLCLGAACAARSSFDFDGFGDSLSFIKSKAAAAGRAAGGVVRHHEEDEEKWMDHRAFVAIKYRVPPSMHDKFMDEWDRLEKETTKEKGNIIYDLSKTIEDNLYFLIYGEWETFDDYMHHFNCKHTEDFLDFIDDKDITWELMPLKNVTEVENESRAERQKKVGVKVRSEEDDANRKKKSRQAHVLFQYHVDPSVREDFVDKWEDLAERVWEEDGNVMFALRKVSTNNHHFYGYGTWDSFDDFMDHAESKHVRKFKEFFEDNDIIYFMDPVVKVGHEKEM